MHYGWGGERKKEKGDGERETEKKMKETQKKRETIVTVDLFMVSLIDSAQESMNELALTRLVDR